LKGHTGWVSEVEWYPGGERKLVSGSSVNGLYQEEVVRFWDLNRENALTELNVDLEYAAVGVDDLDAGRLAILLQASGMNNEMLASEFQVFLP